MFIRLMFWLGALVFLALGSLTVVKAPTLTGWKLAILAGEFGHWMALGALLLGTGATLRLLTRGPDPTLVGAALVALIAAGLLLSPVMRAVALGRRVVDDLLTGIGVPSAYEAKGVIAPPFSVRGLFAAQPSTDAVASFIFARGEGYELAMDVHRPARADDPAGIPVIVLVHGGGWNGGERTELPLMTAWLTSQGWAVATIDYRLAPRWTWPAPRDDVAAALRWLRDHAAEVRIDPSRVVLLGRSAGAQIALAVAYDPASPPVQGVISFYGPADVNFAYTYGEEDDVLQSLGLLRSYLGGTPQDHPAIYDDASPILRARRELPPTLLVHGRLDTLVWHRQSERLAARLAEVGAPHYFLSLPWATHAFEYNLHGPGGQLARAAVAAFLDACLAHRTETR